MDFLYFRRNLNATPRAASSKKWGEEQLSPLLSTNRETHDRKHKMRNSRNCDEIT